MKKVLFSGKLLKIFTLQKKLPNGNQGYYECVGHPGGAGILPVFSNGDILLIKQLRPVVGEYLWEIPAGKLEKNEAPSKTVLRELKEETGYVAKKIKKLGEIWTTPGFCQEKIYLYLATELKLTQAEPEAHEIIELHRLSQKKIKQMIQKNIITDSKTLAALLFYFSIKV